MSNALVASYYDHSAVVPGTWDTFADAPMVSSAGDLYEPLTGILSGSQLTPVRSKEAAAGAFAKQDYFWDFYFRIWLTPNGSREIGGVSSDQVIPVSVWNAYPFQGMNLGSLTTSGMEGVTLVSPDDPDSYAPLEQKDYVLHVRTDGPPTVDLGLTWNFPGETLSLRITGSRVRTWPFKVTWVETVLDRYEWLTDVIESYDGREQRAKLRQDPRRTIEATYRIADEEVGLADALIFGWGGRSFLVPVWQDITELSAPTVSGSDTIACEVEAREFDVGGYALVGSDLRSAAAMQIAEILPAGLRFTRGLTTSFAKGEKVFPARTGRLANPSDINLRTAGRATMRGRFEILDQPEIPANPGGAFFNGIPVFTLPHNWKDGVSPSYERRITVIDNATGTPLWLDRSKWSHVTKQMRIVLRTRAERRAFTQFLSWASGRLRPFYRESLDATIKLTPRQPNTETSLLHIENIGYQTLIPGAPGRNAIVARRANGDLHYRNIVGSNVDPLTGDELLTLDLALPAGDPSQWVRIAYLELVRLSADAIEISHRTAGVAEVALSSVGVKQ